MEHFLFSEPAVVLFFSASMLFKVRALTASDGWTLEARDGYATASHAVPLLGVTTIVSTTAREGE